MFISKEQARNILQSSAIEDITLEHADNITNHPIGRQSWHAPSLQTIVMVISKYEIVQKNIQEQECNIVLIFLDQKLVLITISSAAWYMAAQANQLGQFRVYVKVQKIKLWLMIIIIIRPFPFGMRVRTACCDALLGFSKLSELRDWENHTEAKQLCLGDAVAWYNKQTLATGHSWYLGSQSHVLELFGGPPYRRPRPLCCPHLAATAYTTATAHHARVYSDR